MVDNEKKSKKNNSPKNNEKSQLYWAIGFILFLVLVFLISNSIFKSLRTFEHEGISFSKSNVGDIPVFHHYYFFTDSNNELVKYNFYLRIDPRKNSVPIEGEIEFLTDGEKFNYISINPEGFDKCEYASAAIGSLTSFLTNNGIKVKGAVPDLEESNKLGVDYATCGHPEGRYVILIQEGEQTKIERDGMCYKIEVANCEILDAVEKFEFKALVDAKKRAESIR